MVIIQLAGGLGNQMFQYALYLQLKNLGKTVKIDDRAGFVEDEKREPVLELFEAPYERATKEELVRMLDSSPLLWHKMRRKLCGRKKKSYFETDRIYHPEIMEWDDIYLEGYWQTEKYFEQVERQVREAFEPKRLARYLIRHADKGQAAHNMGVFQGNPPSGYGDNGESKSAGEVLQEWMAKISDVESISLHVRRGDYLLPENQALFGGICTDAYYKEAMERMRQAYPGCRFYLFTNDKEWGRRWALEAPDVENVDMGCFSALGDYAEFVLMSMCRHNILANSSFSWWASYLNKNPDKRVLAPDRWLNKWDCSDIYRPDMTKVSI